MKNVLIALVAVLSIAMVSCNQGKKVNTEVVTKTDSVAYALGVIFGKSLPSDFPDINTEIITKTMTEVVAGEVEPMFASQQEAGMFIQMYLQSKSDTTIVFAQPKIDSVASAVGYFYGTHLKNDFSELNHAITCEALEAAYVGTEKPMFENDQAADTFIQEFMMAKAEKENEAFKIESEEFLAANAKKEGITVTESGLQYEVLSEGNGPKPQSPSDVVSVTYHGTLIDGTVFDSSVERGDTASFGLNQVIPGWTEGVQLMNVGSKYRFYVPSDLAYGANPRPGGIIKPYAALIFDVELIGINED